MSFIAKKKSTGERVDIRFIKNPREELNKDDLICCGCEQPLIIKSGLIRNRHFAHAASECSYASNPESPEHLYFKDYISRRLPLEFEEYANAIALIEYPIHDRKRIADVCFEFDNGWKIIHEIQLSSITVEEIERRTNDYEQSGYSVIWWIGKNANTPAVREWLIKRFGECITIDYKELSQQTIISP